MSQLVSKLCPPDSHGEPLQVKLDHEAPQPGATMLDHPPSGLEWRQPSFQGSEQNTTPSRTTCFALHTPPAKKPCNDCCLMDASYCRNNVEGIQISPGRGKCALQLCSLFLLWKCIPWDTWTKHQNPTLETLSLFKKVTLAHLLLLLFSIYLFRVERVPCGFHVIFYTSFPESLLLSSLVSFQKQKAGDTEVKIFQAQSQSCSRT